MRLRVCRLGLHQQTTALWAGHQCRELWQHPVRCRALHELQVPSASLTVQPCSCLPRRYERFSGAQRLQGAALVQRHVALPEDLANKAGKGLLVRPPATVDLFVCLSVCVCSACVACLCTSLASTSRASDGAALCLDQVQKKDLDNAAILGQTQPKSAQYL